MAFHQQRKRTSKRPAQLSLYEQTTVEMAREAARAINEYMAHWDDHLSPEVKRLLGNKPSPYHGAKVYGLERLMVVPEYAFDKDVIIWFAHFDRDVSSQCFAIRNGKVESPSRRSFWQEDLRELDTLIPPTLPDQEVEQ